MTARLAGRERAAAQCAAARDLILRQGAMFHCWQVLSS